LIKIILKYIWLTIYYIVVRTKSKFEMFILSNSNNIHFKKYILTLLLRTAINTVFKNISIQFIEHIVPYGERFYVY